MTSFDPSLFLKRLCSIYERFENGDLKSADAICIVVGDVDIENTVYRKSFTAQAWLFGMEIPNLILVFCSQCIVLASNEDTLSLMRERMSSIDDSAREFKFKYLPLDSLDPIIDEIKKSRNGESIGMFVKEKPLSDLGRQWKKMTQAFTKINITSAFVELAARKETTELDYIKTSCDYLVGIYNQFLKKEMCEIVSHDKKVMHSKLSDMMAALVSNSKYIKKEHMKHVDIAFSPIIQSGPSCSLKFSSHSDEKFIDFGAIVCMFGLRFRGYCSSLTRTFLVSPDDETLKNANVMLNLYEFLLKQLKDGAVKSLVNWFKGRSGSYLVFSPTIIP